MEKHLRLEKKSGMQAGGGAFQNIFKNQTYVALLLILLLASVLRFYHITERGLFLHDAGNHFLAPKLYVQATRWLFTHLDGLRRGSTDIGELKQFIVQTGGGSQQLNAKVTHYFSVAAASALTGFKDYTVLIVTATYGFLTVLLVYLLGSYLYTNTVGLLAAGILAVSPYHVYYSLSGLSQPDAVFFLTLAAYLYLKSKDSNTLLVLAGLSIGFAFCAHINVFWAPLAFIAYEVYALYGTGVWRDVHLRRIGLLCLSMLFPLLLFESIFRVGDFLLSRMGLDSLQQLRFQTYFEQLYGQYTWKLGTEPECSRGPFYFLSVFWHSEGPFMSFFLVLGLFYLCLQFLYKRRLGDIVILTMFLTPLILWSFFIYKEPRNTLSALPAFSLISALGFFYILETVQNRLSGYPEVVSKGLKALTLLVILGLGTFRSEDIITAKSSYREASRQLKAYLESHPGRVISQNNMSSLSEPLWRVYLGNLVDYDADRGNILFFDWGMYLQDRDSDRRNLELMAWLKDSQPIVVVPNNLRGYFLTYETIPSKYKEIFSYPDSKFIKIYDLALFKDTIAGP